MKSKLKIAALIGVVVLGIVLYKKAREKTPVTKETKLSDRQKDSCLN